MGAYCIDTCIHSIVTVENVVIVYDWILFVCGKTSVTKSWLEEGIRSVRIAFLSTTAQFQKRSHHCEKKIGSLISLQITISWSDPIPWTILFPSDHDPGDPACYVDRCWIRYFITTIDHFISNITIVKIYKLPGNIYWNMVCLVSTVCIFSMTLITYTYLSNMACPNHVLSWANIVCMH